MVLSSEGFPANVAGIRSLICVCPLVDEQVVGLGELAVAVLADELFLWSGTRRARRSQWWRIPYRHPLGHRPGIPQGMMVYRRIPYPLVHEHRVIGCARRQGCHLSLDVSRHRMRVGLRCDRNWEFLFVGVRVHWRRGAGVGVSLRGGCPCARLVSGHHNRGRRVVCRCMGWGGERGWWTLQFHQRLQWKIWGVTCGKLNY